MLIVEFEEGKILVLNLVLQNTGSYLESCVLLSDRNSIKPFVASWRDAIDERRSAIQEFGLLGK